jgi:PIN domain nuclease of toxin-antitoxin system
LDASAILAFLNDEVGSDAVDRLLPFSVTSTVNTAEVFAKLARLGVEALSVSVRLEALGLRIVPFTIQDALTTGRIWPRTVTLGLSLGDRACIALGLRLKLPVWTADRAWTRLESLGQVRLIR